MKLSPQSVAYPRTPTKKAPQACRPVASERSTKNADVSHTPTVHDSVFGPGCTGGPFAFAWSIAPGMPCVNAYMYGGLADFDKLTVQGVPHARVDLTQLRKGDIVCVHLPRFSKTANQLAIALAQRWRAGRLKRLPFDQKVRGSVNVTHTFIILDVDAAQGRMRVAEASGKRGVCQATFDFANFQRPDSHVARGANFLVYRLTNPDQAARMCSVAAAWSAAGGAYDQVGAACAPWRRNSLGWSGQMSLCHLAARSGDMPLRDRLGTPHAMFCSQFVARVWGWVTVTPALEKAELLGSSHASARREVKKVFACSPNTVLPTSLHRELIKDPRVETVGFFTHRVSTRPCHTGVCAVGEEAPST